MSNYKKDYSLYKIQQDSITTYLKKYNLQKSIPQSPKTYLKDYDPITFEYLLKSNFLSEFKTNEEKELAKQSLNIKNGLSAYEEAVNKGLISNYDEWIKLLKGDKGDKGDSGKDGTVYFDELTDTQKSDLITRVVTDTQLDLISLNPIANLVLYRLYVDLLDKYKDTLNMNISLSNIITSMQDLMLHLGIPIVLVTDDEYDELESNGLLNPNALYLTSDEDSAIIKDLSGAWVFGGTFPISFGTQTEKEESSFVFDGIFPILFGSGEKATNEFDLEFTITFK